jgi:uncharacterized protein with PIN domain
MTTPIEAGVIWRGWLSIKHGLTYVFVLGKRIATLEARVTALEEALQKQPPDACPYCGERAMRLTEQSGLLGNQGSQWTEETWTCGKCGKRYYEREKLKAAR